jgi:23S rRNA (uridine2552-2'-O)-methyltransferase
MAPLAGVEFMQGDFTDDGFAAAFAARLQGRTVDLVLSDIAPNMSGIGVSDQARSIHLCELALLFAEECLAPGGGLLVKTFQGAGFESFRAAMQQAFETVLVRKPDASRDRSSETYLLGVRRKAVR